MSTKTEPGAFDGLERAEPDEPVFTLRAHDPLAAKLVHEWVRLRRDAIIRARPKLTKAKRTIELIQCREAEEVAFAMVEWAKGQATESTADEPTLKSKGASPLMGAVEMEAKAKFDAIKGAASTVHNAVAGVHDAAEMLKPYDTHHAAVLWIAAEQLKEMAIEFQPKRASYAHLSDEPVQ